MKLRLILVAGGLAAGLISLALWRLADHDLEWRHSEGFEFSAAGQSVSGTLWLPDGRALAGVVLVHGDGAQDRTAAGGYAPLINSFLDRGIAVAAWDKPGVGASEGNWLLQSMEERTAETRAALHQLTTRLEGIAVGAVGFSQAGWVLPGLSRQEADFLVLIGPAVSWRDQGRYYTRMRLGQAGSSAAEIDQTLAEQARANDRIFGADASPSDAPAAMSPDRWRFIQQNRHADARQHLSRLEPPLFAIWGADDLNVDAPHNAALYQSLLEERAAATKILVWPEATHGLLKAPAYNWQLAQEWSWAAQLRFVAEGRYAFAPGALGAITDWIEERARASDSRS